MIYDKIANAARYMGISEHLDAALRYMMNADFSAWKDGRNEVDGEDIYVNVMNITTSSDGGREYEFHREYYDIHVVIEGCEKVLVAEDLAELTRKYTSEGDFGLGHAKAEAYGEGRPGYFVICDIEEPHLPACAEPGQEQAIRKAVIKVRR